MSLFKAFINYGSPCSVVETDRGRHEAELWMKTYGICGSPRVPIL
ncbi:hypothetical protein T4B_6794 [Trichinella pseudospiralis]|uniref:Uncharacterized protein n=1 Tax=Trichinella pseudospiralis TaxID=6337 RepID=A0A0V1GK58_TRIPS|nr:hypothetical protein T4B_6794 [Trichinella pseudospiralis]